jgi:Domain of unknown function (DUF4263)
MTKRLKQIKTAIAEFTKLVDNCVMEREIQRFLESHPYLVLSGYHVRPGLVISQLPLGSDHRVDFAYLYGHSGGSFIQLIEFERPAMPVFRKDDDFRHDFNHALQQAFDWISWSQRNIDYLRDVLEPLIDYGAWPPDRVRALVVAGRRAEFTNQRRKERWAHRKEMLKEVTLTTYDGFIEGIPIGRFVNNPSEEVRCVTYNNRDFFEKAVDDVFR